MQPTPIKLLASALGYTMAGEELITHVSTDSRDITPGCVFVCVKGARFDGHDFAPEAVRQGASYVVASERVPLTQDKVFYVDNTLDALIKLAGAYRSQFSPITVGVTGSVGKTTTKEFIAAVASRRYKTLKNEGNQNTEIGVPNTIWKLDQSHECAVIEMGQDKMDDILKLTMAVRPDIAVVTSVGTAHIEFLGSRENILRGKLQIADSMGPHAPLILCADNDLLGGITNGYNEHLRDKRIVRFGIEAERCDVRAVNIREGERETRFTVRYPGGEVEATIPTIGRHTVLDALAAFAVGLEMKIGPKEIALGLYDYAPAGMRQHIVPCEAITLVEDCYNANPDSMKAALSTFGSMKVRGRRVAVLGDMLELGETAKDAHYEVGRFAAAQGLDLLFCYGRWCLELCRGAKGAGMGEAYYFPTQEEMYQSLRQSLQEGDTVWLKASLGMKLGESVSRLREEYQGR